MSLLVILLGNLAFLLVILIFLFLFSARNGRFNKKASKTKDDIKKIKEQIKE